MPQMTGCLTRLFNDRAVGISVDNNKGGWDSLLAFARARDKENREAAYGAISRRKGSRELKGLTRSINHAKNNNRNTFRRTSKKEKDAPISYS